jgi:hypothetical protein
VEEILAMKEAEAKKLLAAKDSRAAEISLMASNNIIPFFFSSIKKLKAAEHQVDFIWIGYCGATPYTFLHNYGIFAKNTGTYCCFCPGLVCPVWVKMCLFF